MNVKTCIEICDSSGFIFAGLEGGTQCRMSRPHRCMWTLTPAWARRLRQHHQVRRSPCADRGVQRPLRRQEDAVLRRTQRAAHTHLREEAVREADGRAQGSPLEVARLLEVHTHHAEENKVDADECEVMIPRLARCTMMAAGRTG